MAVLEPDFPVPLPGEGPVDVGAPGAQRLRLAACQNDAGLDPVLDGIVAECLAVAGDCRPRRDVLARHSMCQARTPACLMASLTLTLVSSAGEVRGRRTEPSPQPSRPAAYLTGPGLVSLNSAS